MPILAPILVSYYTDLARLFGAYAVAPIIVVMAVAYFLSKYIRSLQDRLTAKDAMIADLQEKRVADAREMIRVVRETEQARALRRALDERFLPVQEATLQILREKGSP